MSGGDDSARFHQHFGLVSSAFAPLLRRSEGRQLILIILTDELLYKIAQFQKLFQRVGLLKEMNVCVLRCSFDISPRSERSHHHDRRGGASLTRTETSQNLWPIALGQMQIHQEQLWARQREIAVNALYEANGLFPVRHHVKPADHLPVFHSLPDHVNIRWIILGEQNICMIG
jgi:hypothetical protein